MFLLLVAGCRSASVPVWDDVEDSVRQRQAVLHQDLQVCLRTLEGPARRSELSSIRAELEALLQEHPLYFRAQRDLQDVLAEVDAEIASREYSRFQEMESAARICLAARWLPVDDAEIQRELYRSARSLDPEFVWAHYGEAMVEARAQEWGDAVALLDEALDLSPDFPEAIALRARVLDRAGRSEEALEAYAANLDSDSGDVEARYRRAHLLLQSDQNRVLREARRDLERVLTEPAALGELAGSAALDLGVVQARLGDPQGALGQLDRALQLGANPLDVQYNRGWLLEEMLDRPHEALDAYREYLRIASRGEAPMRAGQVLDYLFHVSARVRNLEEQLEARDGE